MFGLALVCPADSPAQAAPASARLPTLFVVGDLPAESYSGLFDTAHLQVQASAAAGRTTRAYINSGEWDRVLGQMKPGDVVLIEFAPSTMPPLERVADKPAATRTVEGVGDGTFDYLDPGTGKLELVHSFGWYLRRMVVDTINHGASPILCSPPAGMSGQGGAQRTMISAKPGEAPAAQPTAATWTQAIAMELRVPFVDASGTGTTLTEDGLRAGLEALPADPLGPYLKKKAQ